MGNIVWHEYHVFDKVLGNAKNGGPMDSTFQELHVCETANRCVSNKVEIKISNHNF
jgi:hypothetical protein